jgi:peptidoglycan hydrolase CwlO-like protein
VKTLVILVLIVTLSFVAYRSHQQKLEVQAALEESVQREAEEKKKAETDVAKLKQERDEARQEVVAANAEIGRLTQTTPKPVSWFNKRIEESSERLTSKPAPAGGVHRPGQTAPQP